jgi:hypothetical protein
MNRLRLHRVLATGAAVFVGGLSFASAQTAPSLGAAGSFAVLAGSTVTNTGPTVVTGDVGVSPGSAVVGFPPGIVLSGTIHSADAVALQAKADLVTAYNSLAAGTCTQDLSGQDLGGLVLAAGVYCFSSSAALTGTLTLDAGGNPAAVFIIRTGSTLITASGSSVSLINGASPCNVFWQVGSSATLGTTSSFAGDILALTSITLNTGATVAGRALAQNGAVTLDGSTITAVCATTPPPPACPAITLSPATLPSATAGVAYNQTISAVGGTTPYVFAVTGGSLPAGLGLSAGGVVSGTPAASGLSAFTIRGTDGAACFAELNYTVAVLAAVPTLPQVVVVLLAAGLVAVGCLRLRRRA